jgi:Fe-S-cluster containining protein
MSSPGTTSLLPHCIPCGSTCCRYSSPIVSAQEREAIVAASGADCFVEQCTAEGSYFVIGLRRDGSPRTIALTTAESGDPCSYLASDGRCSIQAVKPLDCRAYPIRALPGEGQRIEWRLHRACPASPHLTPPFLETALAVAKRSLQRFAPEVYRDWLRRFSPWPDEPEEKYEPPPQGED